MARLDAALTLASWKDVAHTARDNDADVERFVYGCGDRAYYLSDGGYSRICCNLDGKLFLTSNSRNEVKDRWSLCTGEIAKVEEMIRVYMES